MANQRYGYASSYGGSAPPSSSPPSLAASRSLTDTFTLSRYLASIADHLPSSDPSRHSSMYLTQSDAHILRYSTERSIASPTPTHLATWPPPPGVDIPSPVDPLASTIKRTSEVLYHPTVLGAHSTIGQSEAWYSTNSFAKRPRFEISSNLPIYPQRPGEKDCTHYMLTRTCKFGNTCKFDHPIWVPEGGIPDWKEVPLISTSEFLPERPGEPDCPYFLKTQRCKYGPRCKFNHPKEELALDASENSDTSALPERPSEPPCAFYLKTGKCKFGATCKFHHPKDIQIPLVGEENGIGLQTSVVKTEGTSGDTSVVNSLSFTPAPFHNSKGLPVRIGEVDCPFYLKTGSCKYGATCRYNHPDRNEINPSVAALGHAIVSPVGSLNIGAVNPISSIYQTIDPRLAQTTLGVGSTIYPQRPGQTECDYYMKTGECKFGERCRFHHPVQTALQSQQQIVKLTLAGLPRREGAIHCPYYMKTGTCKYAASCKFDHPPPGEVLAIAASQGALSSEGQGQGAEAGNV